MKAFKSIILTETLDPKNFNTELDYDDTYWDLVLNYPLIFLPNNKIIFWGFEVKILKNEYELLKSLITLNTNNKNNQGFTEDEIIVSVDYKRRDINRNKEKSIQRFITTSISHIKKQLKRAIVESCINQIRFNKFNPFKECQKIIDKEISDKDLDTELKTPKKYKALEKMILQSDLNLTKILTHLQNLTNVYDEYYSSFIFTKEFKNLICSKEGQKQKSKHRLYKTSFVFCTENFQRDYKNNPRKRCKDKRFQYAKYNYRTKYNTKNFVNYPQYRTDNTN